MADFPSSLRRFVGTKETWSDPRLISQARSGAVHMRLLQSQKIRKFSVNLKDMTDADRLAFETFYDSNRDQTFTLTYKGVVYNVAFADNEITLSPTEATYQDAQCSLIEMI